MTDKITELSDVTCWMGHEVPQEQWRIRRETIGARPATVYEYDCHCGERLTVIVDCDGSIIEERSDP